MSEEDSTSSGDTEQIDKNLDILREMLHKGSPKDIQKMLEIYPEKVNALLQEEIKKQKEEIKKQEAQRAKQEIESVLKAVQPQQQRQQQQSEINRIKNPPSEEEEEESEDWSSEEDWYGESEYGKD